MSKALMTIEGFLTEPNLKYVGDGRPVLNLTIPHTPSKKNDQTGEWEDTGETMWATAAIWGQEAEFWADQLNKGDLVRLAGKAELRTYTKNNNTLGVNIDLKSASVALLRAKNAQGGRDYPQTGYGRQDQSSQAWTPSQGGQDPAGVLGQVMPGNNPAPF